MPDNVNALNAYNLIIRPGQNNKGSGKDELKDRTAVEQFVVDTAYWYGTIQRAGGGTAAAFNQAFLKRMWAMIWHGGLWYRSGLNSPWKAWDAPVASCLSHGGRVLIQLPTDNSMLGNRSAMIWNWLWGNQHPQTRKAGTHGVEHAAGGAMPNGMTKYVRENKKGKSGTHFGLNLAGGGFGNTNPVSGNMIKNDGRHGHLYICYMAPTATRTGALLFGAEDSAPIDRAPTKANQVVGGVLGNTVGLPLTALDLMTGGGWKRQPKAPGLTSALPKGQTGAYHAFGVSGKYSLTGGQKWKKMTDGPSGNDQMFVCPSRATFDRLIAGQLTFDVNNIGYIPPPKAGGEAFNVTKAVVKEFKKKWSFIKRHRRNKHLRDMDTALDAYLNDGRQMHLREAYVAGVAYQTGSNDPDSVKSKVATFTGHLRDLGWAGI